MEEVEKIPSDAYLDEAYPIINQAIDQANQAKNLSDGNQAKLKQMIVTSNNLFDYTAASLNYYVNPDSGALITATTNDTSDFIAVDPSKDYVKNSKGHVAFYDINKIFLSGLNESIALANVSFKTPANAKYLRFSVKKSEGFSIETTQLELGTTPSEYKAYGQLNNAYLPPVPSSKVTGRFSGKSMDFLSPSKNLFNKSTVTLNKFINPTGGNAVDSANSDSSDYIEIDPSTDYVKNVKGHVAFYTSGKVFISGINESTALAGISFTSPATAKYLRFSIKKSEGFSIETAQLEKGTTPTAYSNYGVYSIDTSKVSIGSGTNTNGYSDELWVSVGDSITAADTYQPIVAGYFGLDYVNCGFPGRTTAGLTQDDVFASIPSNAKVITFMAGTNDQGQNVPLDDVAGYEYSTGTYPGSIRKMIQRLQESFPNALIIFATCVGGRGLVAGENMTYQPKNTLGYTTEDYAKKCIAVCHEMSIPVIDVFGNSGINQLNRATYISDLVHPNLAGAKRLANVFINGMKQHEPISI